MATSSKHPQVIFIGIAGPSGCGKTTYARHLTNRLHSPLKIIQLDDFFYRSVPINHPILGHCNSEEEPETLETSRLLKLVRQIKYEPEKQTKYHKQDVSINNEKQIFVVAEGFLLFALSDELTNMFDIRIFLESTQSECRMKRYRREYSIDEKVSDEQIAIPIKFQKWFDYLVWEGHLKRRDLQLSKVKRVFNFEEYKDKKYIELDNYIDKRLKDIIK